MQSCRARARIFSVNTGGAKVLDESSNGKGNPNSWTLPENGNSDKIPVKAASIAKGPVEGSRGFERRRNRRGTGNTSAVHPNNLPVSAASLPDGKPLVRKPGYSDGNGRGPARSGRDTNCNGVANGFGSVPPTSSSNFTSLGGARRYANDSTFGDLQDPDFDRSYMKWARRGPVTSAPSVQAPTAGLPIYAAPLVYPYVTQALPQHPIHSAPISVHSSIELPPTTPLVAPHAQAGLTNGLSTSLAGMHHRGVLANAPGMSLSMGLGLGTNIPRRDTIDVGGNEHLFTNLDQRYREDGGAMFAPPNLGISCGVSGSHTTGAVPIPCSSIQDVNFPPNAHGISKMRMPIDLPQPQHTVSAMMNWPSPQAPAVVRSPPPSYGLDSTVDFPPLR